MKQRNVSIALSTLALAVASFVANAADHVFANTAPISAEQAGFAHPYPSVINASGLIGDITNVQVTVNGFTSWDLDAPMIAIVSPGGQKIMLFNGFSDTTSTYATQWTFSNTGVALPATGSWPVPSGTYLPSNYYGSLFNPLSPAPSGPYSTDLSSLNGPAAVQNGSWQLYVFNFLVSDVAQPPLTISDGWTLTITTEDPTTCASEGYTGTKLTWCQNICEMGYTGATLNMWIRRWTDRYRTLPYCALEPDPA